MSEDLSEYAGHAFTQNPVLLKPSMDHGVRTLLGEEDASLSCSLFLSGNFFFNF